MQTTVWYNKKQRMSSRKTGGNPAGQSRILVLNTALRAWWQRLVMPFGYQTLSWPLPLYLILFKSFLKRIIFQKAGEKKRADVPGGPSARLI